MTALEARKITEENQQKLLDNLLDLATKWLANKDKFVTFAAKEGRSWVKLNATLPKLNDTSDQIRFENMIKNSLDADGYYSIFIDWNKNYVSFRW